MTFQDTFKEKAPANILQEAQELIYNDRNTDYGHPLDDFTRTAKMWTALKGVEFTPQEVAEFMICVKLSRLRHRYKRDSICDLAGYAGTIEMLDIETKRREKCSG